MVLKIMIEDTRWIITLDRPERRNALNAELRTALLAALRDFDADPDSRVAILTGTDPAFCAGMDLHEMSRTGVKLDVNAETYVTVTSPETAGMGGPHRLRSLLGRTTISATWTPAGRLTA